MNENKMDILTLKVKLQNMKADEEHDSLSERQIKGIQENADYIPMKGHLELCTLKQKGAAITTVIKKKVFLYGWCEDWGERWCPPSGW